MVNWSQRCGLEIRGKRREEAGSKQEEEEEEEEGEEEGEEEEGALQQLPLAGPKALSANRISG